MIPVNETEAPFGRDVRQILRASEVGLRWADNIGPEVRFDYVGDSAPYTVRVALPDRPRAILCLYAENLTDPIAGAVTGARVQWLWIAGGVRIIDVDTPSTSNTYRVTLGIVKG